MFQNWRGKGAPLIVMNHRHLSAHFYKHERAGTRSFSAGPRSINMCWGSNRYVQTPNRDAAALEPPHEQVIPPTGGNYADASGALGATRRARFGGVAEWLKAHAWKA